MREIISRVLIPQYLVYSIAVLLCCFCAAFTVIIALNVSGIPHFTPLTEESGIIGWVTLNHYPKDQDIFFYVLSIILPALFSVSGLLFWIYFSIYIEKKYAKGLEESLIMDGISYVAFPASFIFLLFNPGFSFYALLIMVLGFLGIKLVTAGIFTIVGAKK